jgi:hypothetical protein
MPEIVPIAGTGDQSQMIYLIGRRYVEGGVPTETTTLKNASFPYL